MSIGALALRPQDSLAAVEAVDAIGDNPPPRRLAPTQTVPMTRTTRPCMPTIASPVPRAGWCLRPELVARLSSIPLDSVESSGSIAVTSRRVEIAAGTLEAGTVAAQRTTVSGMRDGRELLCFRATWFCTTEIDQPWDLLSTGWKVFVEGDAPLDIDIRFPLDLEQMGAVTPGYTANRAVNAIPYVCAAAPGIRSITDLPQILTRLS